MKKNEERIGTVIGIGMNGEGVIKDDNKIVFVPFSLVGEKIKYRVLKVNSDIAYGKVVEVLTPAEDRVRPKCPVFQKCGGCHLQHLKYEAQLRVKENNVKVCFHKIAHLDIDVKPTVKGASEFYYRNKLQLPVQGIDNPVIGFYAENSHRIIEISDCPINGLWTKNIISAFNEYFKASKERGYDELTGEGDIRGIAVKEIKDNLIITVISTKENLKDKQLLICILKDYIKLNFSLYLNINKSKNNVVLGDDFKLLYGEPDYSSEMLGIKYSIGVRSFMQVNNSVCFKLYSAVKNAVNLDGNNVVIDAYSGAGLMTAILAKDSFKAIGIEIVKEAVELADKLKTDNGLDGKMENHLGACEDILPTIVEREKCSGKKIGIVLDPPRKGCDIKVINAVKDSGADIIVYVSCMPSTLARDVGLICGTLSEQDGKIVKAEQPIGNYRVETVRTFDMFAQTKHVETLCVLKKV